MEIVYSVLNSKKLKQLFDINCADSTLSTEWSLHQLSPYIGKIKSSIAHFLIENFTKPKEIVYDPFCGAGTIPFEAWAMNRRIVANDLNKYAIILTMAKLFPPKNLNEVTRKIETFGDSVAFQKRNVDLRRVPKWVRSFYHRETLREIIAWVKILEESEEWFILACLLGILHHQRPGFLSYPSSHTVPYLRIYKFPKDKFPGLYEYRNVKERLLKKVVRAYKKIPKLNKKLKRDCYSRDASTLILPKKVDNIISSPPYMRQLDYARDNRLRLWFLGIDQIRELDEKISPKESNFVSMISECLKVWKKILRINGNCILFLGDNYSKKYKLTLPEIIERIAVSEIKGYKLIFKHQSIIPENRRVRRKYSGNSVETILVLKRVKEK